LSFHPDSSSAKRERRRAELEMTVAPVMWLFLRGWNDLAKEESQREVESFVLWVEMMIKF
jgi:hypothetical protein